MGIALLQCLDEVCPKLSKEIGTWVTYAPMNNDNQKKLNRTILLLLVRSKLVKITDLDIFITRSMADGRNTIWIEFAILFVRTAVMEKIALLNKALGITVRTLMANYERSKGRTHWDQRPWFRLLLNLVFDL